jgi:hypothetical protein
LALLATLDGRRLGLVALRHHGVDLVERICG